MKSDWLIKLFLEDENYRVCSSSQIFSRYTRQGHLSDNWRELKHRKKQRYSFICYQKSQLAIHRIVATAFLGKIPKGHQVNHKDGNPDNNDLSNLEIVTQSQNIKHRLYALHYFSTLKTHLSK